MPNDGLEPMPFHEVSERIGKCGFPEVKNEGTKAIDGMGVHAFHRHMMGLGSMPAFIRADGPEDIIYPMEIRHALKTLGIPVDYFLGKTKYPDLPIRE
jgi:hypothetical protein